MCGVRLFKSIKVFVWLSSLALAYIPPSRCSFAASRSRVGHSGRHGPHPARASASGPTTPPTRAARGYAPLDQINAVELQQARGGMAVQDRQPRTASRVQARGHAADGEGGCLHHRRHAALGDRTRRARPASKSGSTACAKGARAANAPRQLSGRGVSYWSDNRGDDRILFVTTGYRLVALNAQTGAPIQSFGKNGILDLKEGVVYGNRQPIDLETGEIGLHSTADHRARRRPRSVRRSRKG